MAESDGYAGLPDRIAEVAARLQAGTEGEVAEDVRHLLALVDELHRTGLSSLVGLIQQWRGDIFLEALERDRTVGTLLRAYGLPSTGLTTSD